MAATYSIGIVEDDATFRSRLEQVVAACPGCSVTFAVGSGEEALTALADAFVDLVLVDLLMPGMGGIELVREIGRVSPGTEALIVTVLASDQSIFEALRAGAIGYLTKDARPEDVQRAINDVQNGGAPMSPGIARRVVEAFGGGARAEAMTPQACVLSPRERDVLDMLAHGFSYLNIAARLTLSVHTVHAHVRRIYKKLHVNSRAEAVYEASRRGWIAMK